MDPEVSRSIRGLSTNFGESSKGRKSDFESEQCGFDSYLSIQFIVSSSNGRTQDSDSCYRGSSPCETANLGKYDKRT